MIFKLFCCKILKTRTHHQLNKHNTTSYNTLPPNDLVWFKLMHSCMHTCLCLNHVEMVCLCLNVYVLLDCGEDLNYTCDCCACTGCFDHQGKWHSCPISTLLYALEFSSSMHDRCFVLFKYYAMLRTPSSVSYPEPQLGKCLAILGYYPKCCLFILVVVIFQNFEN